MKTRFLPALIASAAISVAPMKAAAVLLAYEGFDYTPGQSLVGQSGGLGFSTAWLGDANTTANTLIVAGSFTYTDAFGNTLVTSGNRVWVTGDGRPEGDNFPSGVNGNASPRRLLDVDRGLDSTPTTTWVSVLALRVGMPYLYNSPDGKVAYYGRAVGALQFFYNASRDISSSAGNEMVTIGRASENTSGIDPNRNVDTWAVLNRGSATQQVTSTVPLTNEPVTFIVARIDHNPGTDPRVAGAADRIYVWFNPADLTVEPDINSADLTLTPTQFDSNNDRDYVFNVIRLFGGNFNTFVGYGSVQVDEIRIGTTYFDVAPIPEPSALSLLALGGVMALVTLWLRRRTA